MADKHKMPVEVAGWFEDRKVPSLVSKIIPETELLLKQTASYRLNVYKQSKQNKWLVHLKWNYHKRQEYQHCSEGLVKHKGFGQRVKRNG